MHLNMYVPYGNLFRYIYIYIKYVYSAHCHMVDYSDFICATYMCIHFPYMSIKYLEYMAYMPNVVDIFVSSTYLAVTSEVCNHLVVFSTYVQKYWVYMPIEYVG